MFNGHPPSLSLLSSACFHERTLNWVAYNVVKQLLQRPAEKKAFFIRLAPTLNKTSYI